MTLDIAVFLLCLALSVPAIVSIAESLSKIAIAAVVYGAWLDCRLSQIGVTSYLHYLAQAESASIEAKRIYKLLHEFEVIEAMECK